tara:strand:- start:44039 stop:44386 length:348 start_codon:yes stop_codon:yes gene_type:complete
MVFITLLSLFTFKGVGKIASNLQLPHFDKIVHFIFYFLATILGSFALCELKSTIKIKKALLYVLGFSIIYGTIIELFQYSFTEHRQGDFFDILANSLGAFVGWLVSKHLISKRIT